MRAKTGKLLTDIKRARRGKCYVAKVKGDQVFLDTSIKNSKLVTKFLYHVFFSVFIVHVLEISFHNSKPCKKNLHCFQKTKERWKKTVFTYLAFTTHLSIGKNINTSAQQETKKLNLITTQSGKLTLKLLDKQHTD